MNVRFLIGGILVLSLAVYIGCESDNEPEETQQPAKQQQPAAQPKKQVEPAKPAKPAEEPKKAEVGVGEKGRGYGSEPFVAVPIRSYFAIRERLVFDVSIPEAMKLFKATEGRAPKSHEEFMDKIINANNIHLPQLPKGQHYQYHPDDEQLWVHPDEEK
jgi:hypothetical protein